MNKTFFYKASNLSEDFSWKDIFSEALKPHTKEQRGQVLTRGIAGHVPAASQMLDEWQKPWLFLRFGVIGLLLSILSVWIWNTFAVTWTVDGKMIGFHGLDFAVYMIVAFFPLLAIVIFFWELNIPGTVSIFEVIFLMLAGGLLSILGTGNLHRLIPDIPEALGGPLPEEIAKFAVIALILSRSKYKYGLEGILVGCAIGAGFGAIETAGYGLSQYNSNYSDTMILDIMNKWFNNPSISQQEIAQFFMDVEAALPQYMENARRAATDILIMRGCLAVGGHALWGTLYGGALGLAKKGSEKLKGEAFIDPLVILTWGSAFILHTLWNLNPSQLKGIVSQETINFIVVLSDSRINFVLLIAAGGFVNIIILRKCIRQIIAVSQHTAGNRPKNIQPGAVPGMGAPMNQPGFEENAQEILYVVASGEFQRGKEYCLSGGGKLVFGRDAGKANIVFPQDTKGISSVHCEIKVKDRYPVLVDKDSSFGTYFSNGQKLEPNVPYKLKNNVKFYLASETYSFVIKMK